MEFWRPTMLGAVQGQNQVDAMTGWIFRAARDLFQVNSGMFNFWRIPSNDDPLDRGTEYWRHVYEFYFKFNALYMQWIGMVPQSEYTAQVQKVKQLEAQLAEQTRTIEKLQKLINSSGAGNNELIHKFQGLIDQQSKQFQQLTTSVGEFIKSSAKKTPHPDTTR